LLRRVRREPPRFLAMFRTGTFLAAHQFDLTPDIVILAKALSAGLVPISAVLMTNKIYRSVYSSLKRAIVPTPLDRSSGHGAPRRKNLTRLLLAVSHSAVERKSIGNLSIERWASGRGTK
jgi:hypothetical protein